MNRIDTTGLSASGIWVRRQRSAPALIEEALSLAAVLQTWQLDEAMDIEHYTGEYVEISGPDLQPTWIYLIEVIGRRTDQVVPFHNHPLSQVKRDEAVRIVALVQPASFLIPGALVETEHHRRMIWLQPALSR